ncbi:MAG: S9 family peptidase [Phycisphaerales bacterium]|nr:S9 family peptidase [Phycisphaerales bacterium]
MLLNARTIRRALVACMLTIGVAATASPPERELIPRKVFFGNPDRAAVRLSPDGQWISFHAPWEGVLNVWIAPADKPHEARPLTTERRDPITRSSWSYCSRRVLYLRDNRGDENWRLYAADIENGRQLALTPGANVQAQLLHQSPSTPTSVIVGLNDRDPRLHDLYRVDVESGELELVHLCPPGVIGWVFDESGSPRLARRMGDDGSVELLRLNDAGRLRRFLTVPPDDVLTTGPVALVGDRRLIMRDSRGRDTSALVAIDVRQRGAEPEVLAHDPDADASEVLLHPQTREPQAASFEHLRTRWQSVDPSIEADLRAIRTLSGGEPTVTGRSLDDARWLVAFRHADAPTRYYLMQRDDAGRRSARYLFAHRDDLDGLALAPMHPVVIPSRDGLTLPSYLTLPPHHDNASGPPPMVLLVHGGPWSRDRWGFNPLHQLLADRGYAVLSVNFRGSTGFGKAFVNAGNRQWGAAMQDDLLDSVEWAVEQGHADADRVAIMGASYGGYAALSGLAFTPDTFACGISLVGPSNLVTLLESIPPYWQPLRALWRERVGDVESEQGRKRLLERSPISRVDDISRPLLLVHGANDPRVNRSESDRIAEALAGREVEVTYLLFPNEGHGLRTPENMLAFIACAEAFLARHLGGRAEPIRGAVREASVEVLRGACCPD